MKSWHAEIVRILRNHRLSNAELEFFSYNTHHGTELDQGYYLVLKKADMAHQYTHGVVFFGPFASETQAQVVLQSSRYLGLLTGNSQDKTPNTTTTASVQGDKEKVPILLRRRVSADSSNKKLPAYKNH
jgi:hypothetical protein